LDQAEQLEARENNIEMFERVYGCNAYKEEIEEIKFNAVVFSLHSKAKETNYKHLDVKVTEICI
jgi:hypothetical protein